MAADMHQANPARGQAVSAVTDLGEGAGGLVAIRRRDLRTQAAIAAGLKDPRPGGGEGSSRGQRLVALGRGGAIAGRDSTRR